MYTTYQIHPIAGNSRLSNKENLDNIDELGDYFAVCESRGYNHLLVVNNQTGRKTYLYRIAEELKAYEIVEHFEGDVETWLKKFW